MKRGREEGWKKEQKEEGLCDEGKVFIKVSDTETGSFYFDGQNRWYSPGIQVVPVPSIMINQCSYLTLILFEYHPCGYEKSNGDGKFSGKGDRGVNGSISPWVGERLVQNWRAGLLCQPGHANHVTSREDSDRHRYRKMERGVMGR